MFTTQRATKRSVGPVYGPGFMPLLDVTFGSLLTHFIMLSFSRRRDKTQMYQAPGFHRGVAEREHKVRATHAAHPALLRQPPVARRSTFTVMSGDTLSATTEGIEIL